MDIDGDDDDADAGLDIEEEARATVAPGNQKRTVDEVYKKVGRSASLRWTVLK
jgi:hypothetical protein